MQRKKHHPIIILINILLFFFIYIFQYNGVIDISIKTATPLLIIPLITAFSMFNSFSVSAVTGLIVGTLMDGSSSTTLCFNTIVIVLSAVFVCVTSNNLFNKNILSAILLTVIISFVYFGSRFLFYYGFNSTSGENLTYLLKYALPSIVYTTVFIFPFYFLYRHFNKLLSE